MNRRMVTRLVLDGSMAASFIILMADRYTGNGMHEWLGVLLLLLVFMHVRIHAVWWTALPRLMRGSPARTVVTLLATLFFAAAVISAVPVSETVFTFLNMHGSLEARGLHVFFAHWSFVLAAFHFGMYGAGVASAAGRVLPVPVPLIRRLAWAAALYGAYAFVARELVLPLFMQSSFTLWHEGDGPVLFFLDYLAVFHASAWISYGVATHCSGRRKERKRTTAKDTENPAGNRIGQELKRIVSGGFYGS